MFTYVLYISINITPFIRFIMLLALIVVGSGLAVIIIAHVLDYFCCKSKKAAQPTKRSLKKYRVLNGPLPSYGWL